MSGEGGGGGGGGNGHPPPPDGPCNRLSFETAVQSPAPEVVARLIIGDILNVVLEGRIVFVYSGRDRVGTLIFPALSRLIDCLEQDFAFVAEITYLSGPDCRVRIRPQ